MGRTTRPLFPRSQDRLAKLGGRLRDARLRRRLSQEGMAARVGVSRTTIAHLERGDPRVNLAALVRTLTVLGLDSDLELLVGTDEIGRRLQDLEMPQRAHASRPERGGR